MRGIEKERLFAFAGSLPQKRVDGGNVRQTVGIQVAPGERKDLRVGVDREPTEVAAAAVPKVARKEADVAANIHDRSDGASAFERGSVDVPHDDLIEKEQTFQVAYLENRTRGQTPPQRPQPQQRASGPSQASRTHQLVKPVLFVEPRDHRRESDRAASAQE